MMDVVHPPSTRSIIIPTLWFDDFSPGCGACGKIAHTFRECPNKNAPIPTLQLTLKKPSSKTLQFDNHTTSSMSNEGWNMIGKKNKIVSPSNFIIPNNNIYLTERGGIHVNYESEDSEEGLQHMLENEEITIETPYLVSVAADLHPYNIIMEEKKNHNPGNKNGTPTLNMAEKDQDLEHPSLSEWNLNALNASLSNDITNTQGDVLDKVEVNLINEFEPVATKHPTEQLDYGGSTLLAIQTDLKEPIGPSNPSPSGGNKVEEQTTQLEEEMSRV